MANELTAVFFATILNSEINKNGENKIKLIKEKMHQNRQNFK